MAKQIWTFEPTDRWVRAISHDETVADSKRAMLMLESRGELDYLQAVDTKTHCPYKGDSSYYNLVVNGESYENAAWYYPEPIPEAPRLKGTISFWPEKDRRIELVIDGETI